MSVAGEHNLKIPADLSIVGFDDNPSGLYGLVALTTVRQPLVKMAQDSVKELSVIMNLGKKAPVRKVFLPTELVIRESCQRLSP
jgi:LacI family transcriptional regulator